jgi:hypothetical protein
MRPPTALLLWTCCFSLAISGTTGFGGVVVGTQSRSRGKIASAISCRAGSDRNFEGEAQFLLGRRAFAVNLAGLCAVGASAGTIIRPAWADEMSLTDALTRIERVREACSQLSSDVEKGEIGDVQLQIRRLVSNYRLEDALNASKRSAPKKARETAAAYGRDALEYFEQMISYFPERINNTTGTRIVVLDAARLQFVIDALLAASEKLAAFENALDVDSELDAVRKMLKEEAQET